MEGTTRRRQTPKEGGVKSKERENGENKGRR